MHGIKIKMYAVFHICDYVALTTLHFDVTVDILFAN
jgi:hypothetical protein